MKNVCELTIIKKGAISQPIFPFSKGEKQTKKSTVTIDHTSCTHSIN